MMRIQDYPKALTDFNQAILIDPKYAEAYHHRGLIHLELKDNSKALKDFNQVITLDPDWAEAYYYRALAYDALDNISEVKKDLKTAAALFKQQGKLDEHQSVLV